MLIVSNCAVFVSVIDIFSLLFIVSQKEEIPVSIYISIFYISVFSKLFKSREKHSSFKDEFLDIGNFRMRTRLQ